MSHACDWVVTRPPTSSVPVDIANYVCLWDTVQASNSCCAHSLMIYSPIKITKLRKLYEIFGVNDLDEISYLMWNLDTSTDTKK